MTSNLCIGCGDDLSPETHPLQECPCGEWRCAQCLLDSARHQKHRADDLERRLRLAHAMLRRLGEHRDSDGQPSPPPRYDDVYHSGVEWLDGLADTDDGEKGTDDE